MTDSLHKATPRQLVFATLPWVALLTCGLNAQAAESFKLRQAPVGAFGGEIAVSADKPGFFGTASLTQLQIYKITDASGNDVAPPPISPIQLSPTLPNKVVFPAGSLAFNQDQTQLNVVGGYLTESTYGNGHMVFAINLPFIQQKRSYIVTQPAGTLTPAATTPPLPATVVTQLNGGTALANAEVQKRVNAASVAQNLEVSGMGDAELSTVWIRHADRLKVAAGVSLFVPTGSYDKTRGPNPGFGNFYTLRPGVAVTYNLNPKHSDSNWDAGVSIAGRVSYGINTRNKDTDYKSGNFLYAEGGIVKVTGDWAYGVNVFTTQQISDDTGTGAPADGNRYKTNGYGPFVSYKLPGKNAGLNLQFSDNFGGRNAIVAKSLQLRLIKAW
ncbi:MAG: transporter [Burkholderiales bacterium]|nr:transporter [Burkholderiales bacterium]